MAVNLPKIVETPNFSRYCKSTKENGNVTMTFPVNLSHGCFRTAALLMVTLNMESQKLMGLVYPENRFKNAKAHGSERVNSYPLNRDLSGGYHYPAIKQLEPGLPIKGLVSRPSFLLILSHFT